MRASHLSQWALMLAALAWGLLLFVAPAALFPIGRFICHQRPERSFFVGAAQLPVCARCTGLYVGAALAAPLALLAVATPGSTRARAILLLAALPTLLTWTLEIAGVMPFSNIARFAAALPLGAAAAWLVFSALRTATRAAA